jgi:hypothetical protein
MAEACGLSPSLNRRWHCHRFRCIGDAPYESAYRDSPAGKTEEGRLVGRASSLQQGFGGHCRGRLPVGVHGQAAHSASEQGVIPTVMPSTHCTAVDAPFGRVVGVHPVQRDAVVEAMGLQNAAEEVEGDRHHLPVETPPLRLEPRKPLNGDVSFISPGQQDYFPDHLADVRADEIPLAVPHPLQLLQGVEGLQQGPTFLEAAFSRPNVLAEVALLQHVAIRRHDRVGEVLGVDIDAKDVSFRWKRGVWLRQIGHDFEGWGQPVRLARPPASEQAAKPIPVPIRPDGDGDPSSGIKAEFDEVERLGLERLAVAGDVELHGHSLDARAFLLLPPDASCEVADDLNVEPRQSLGFGTDAAPEVVERPVVASFRKKPVNFSSSSLFKRRKSTLFGDGRLGLKKDGSFHSPNQDSCVQNLRPPASFLPPVNGVGFHSEGMMIFRALV